MNRKINIFYVLSFLSAFLLFQIELIIAKVFLPKFGGSYLMWGGCVVFFQCVLLLGYLYAHLVLRIFGIFKYRYFHLFLILLPLAVFPGRPLPSIIAHNNLPLVVDIFLQLFCTVGLVFFVLSTISIISQSWLASSELKEGSNPYRLYAVSNIGSFLGLLTYPFIFEANYGLKEQLIIWRCGYVLFLIVYLVAFKFISYSDKTSPQFKFPSVRALTKKISLRDLFGLNFMWVLLSASGCIAFLSVTNIITYEIAPCPLLWMIPLCIYLISFTLTFREKPICPSWIIEKFHLILGFSVLFYFLSLRGLFPPLLSIIVNLACLFAVCMYCQYHLYMSRPKDNWGLTIFYLLISFGGFLGSFFVTWISPVIFTSTSEYLFGLFIVSLVYFFKTDKQKISFYHVRQIIYLLILIFLWPLVFKGYNFFAIVFIIFAVKIIFSSFKTNLRSVSICIASVFCFSFFVENNWQPVEKVYYAKRNYYGMYKIFVDKGLLQLANGTTVHGLEYFLKEKENEPLAYYHKKTPLGKILQSNNFIFHHVGVVGLGVGTISAYGHENEVIDFFELDKDVYWIASNLFSYLKNTKAKTNFIIGDARISLKNSPAENYDLLVIDAFSGDYVPPHLLTTEAIIEYKRCLKKNGIILFHVSNRYLDLKPILFSNASLIGAYSMKNENDIEGEGYFSSSWVALTWDKDVRNMLVSQFNWKEKWPNSIEEMKIRPWTDDYTNLLSVFKIEYLTRPFKFFTPFYWD